VFFAKRSIVLLTDDNNARLALESLVDEKGLSRIVEWLGDIADEKADHIRANWQDESTAKIWSAAAAKLSRAAFAIAKLKL
jgi:hypothetical protein